MIYDVGDYWKEVYIFLYTKIDNGCLSTVNSTVREIFFFSFLFRCLAPCSMARERERENRYPGIRARRKFGTCFLFAFGLRFMCAKNCQSQRLFLYDWYALSHSEFNLLNVNDDNESKYTCLYMRISESKKIKLPRRNLIMWQITN